MSEDLVIRRPALGTVSIVNRAGVAMPVAVEVLAENDLGREVLKQLGRRYYALTDTGQRAELPNPSGWTMPTPEEEAEPLAGGAPSSKPSGGGPLGEADERSGDGDVSQEAG